MRIAVTGGLGFIGSWLVEELVAHDHEVLVIDIRAGKVPKGAELSIIDILNADELIQVLNGVDAVYHLAGTVLNLTRRNPHLAVNLNIMGTANVLEACVKNGIQKVVYASSFYVYDGLPDDAEVDEKQRSDLFRAEMFGTVKLVGERLLDEYAHRNGLKYVILRYGPSYGLNERCTCAVYDFIKAGLQGEPIVIWGSGTRRNQYTYVGDIAKGSVAALSIENEIFNLISPERVTTRQLAELLAERYDFKVRYDLSKPEGPSMPYISPDKAIKELGWMPTPLREGVEKLYLGYATILESKVGT